MSGYIHNISFKVLIDSEVIDFTFRIPRGTLMIQILDELETTLKISPRVIAVINNHGEIEIIHNHYSPLDYLIQKYGTEFFAGNSSIITFNHGEYVIDLEVPEAIPFAAAFRTACRSFSVKTRDVAIERQNGQTMDFEVFRMPSAFVLNSWGNFYRIVDRELGDPLIDPPTEDAPEMRPENLGDEDFKVGEMVYPPKIDETKITSGSSQYAIPTSKSENEVDEYYKSPVETEEKEVSEEYSLNDPITSERIYPWQKKEEIPDAGESDTSIDSEQSIDSLLDEIRVTEEEYLTKPIDKTLKEDIIITDVEISKDEIEELAVDEKAKESYEKSLSDIIIFDEEEQEKEEEKSPEEIDQELDIFAQDFQDEAIRSTSFEDELSEESSEDEVDEFEEYEEETIEEPTVPTSEVDKFILDELTAEKVTQDYSVDEASKMEEEPLEEPYTDGLSDEVEKIEERIIDLSVDDYEQDEEEQITAPSHFDIVENEEEKSTNDSEGFVEEATFKQPQFEIEKIDEEYGYVPGIDESTLSDKIKEERLLESLTDELTFESEDESSEQVVEKQTRIDTMKLPLEDRLELKKQQLDSLQEELKEVESKKIQQRTLEIEYYEKMNPRKVFPLIVKVKPIITNGGEPKKENGAFKIVPVFPGCYITPHEEMIEMHKEKEEKIEFTVTPLINRGTINGKIGVYYQGRSVINVNTTARINNYLGSTITGILGFVLGVLPFILMAFNININDALANGLNNTFSTTIAGTLFLWIEVGLLVVFLSMMIGFIFVGKPLKKKMNRKFYPIPQNEDD